MFCKTEVSNDNPRNRPADNDCDDDNFKLPTALSCRRYCALLAMENPFSLPHKTLCVANRVECARAPFCADHRSDTEATNLISKQVR